MLRRRFLSTIPSTVALAAAALQPAVAENATQSASPWPSFGEPEPIEVGAATSERARALLDAVASGTFDRSELLPALDAFVPAKAFASGAILVSALGQPQSMFAFEKRIMADQTSTFFRVRFPNQVLTWVVSVDPQNRIAGLSLRRSLNYKIFSVVRREPPLY